MLLFVSPVALVSIVPTYILVTSKENFFDVDRLLTGESKYVLGYTYNEANYRYIKWSHLKLNERKDVWALGSSRVLQFREQTFDKSFYNVGYTISSINDFRPFLKGLPADKLPEYIILGLDQWMFNSVWDNLKTTPSEHYWEDSFSFYPRSTLYGAVYKDLLVKKIPPFMPKSDQSNTRVGFNAILNDTGFRNDGSMRYGKQIAGLLTRDPSIEDFEYAGTLNRIDQGISRFEYGESVNEKALVELNELLAYCSEKKIKVVGFLPPFADKVYNKMMAMDSRYQYIKDLDSKIRPIFEKYDYEVYDFSSITKVGSGDNETIDGFHGSEVAYQRIVIEMLKSGSVLNQVTDLNRIVKDLENRPNGYSVYGD